MQHDKIYSSPQEAISPFSFNQEVAGVFRNMIERSVPGYTTVLETLHAFAQRFYQPSTLIYDLGCSLCDGSLAVANALREEPHQILAIDNSQPMLHEAQRRLNAFTYAHSIKLHCQDITSIDYQPFSLCILNFTLQFIPPDSRDLLLKKLRRACVPQGAICISEKIEVTGLHNNDLLVELHHAWKKHNGYSDLEVSQKRSALENVLVPDRLESLIDRFRRAGFSKVTPWFQHFNFVSLLAEP